MTGSALDAIASALGVARLSDEHEVLLLRMARDVAHSTERRYAPLTAYLIGLSVAGADDRAAALRDAVRKVAATLPELPAPPAN